jgi:murein DD-endopeptidase MepM/ murein hydrolase activator NlpD
MGLLAGCAGAAPQVAQPSCPCGGASVPPPAPSASASAPCVPSLNGVDEVEAELVRRINAKNGKAIVALYAPSMAKAFPEEKTGPFFAEIVDDAGHIVSSERVANEGDRDGTYQLKAERGDWKLELHVDDEGKVTGLLVKPATPPPPVAKSHLPLALPVRGRWSVVQGGERLDVNGHVTHPDQRRAADLEALGPDGTSHRGDGKKNEDYYAYGQDVLAVADGTVVTAIDGVPDNAPGSTNPYMAPGNCVIVKHEGSLYSVYDHLRPGKLRVKVGAKVKQGVVLGSSGNSGNSTQPHLHVQLQDGPLPEASWGVEPVFKDVTVTRDGKSSKMAEYTFLRGDVIGEPAKK